MEAADVENEVPALKKNKRSEDEIPAKKKKRSEPEGEDSETKETKETESTESTSVTSSAAPAQVDDDDDDVPISSRIKQKIQEKDNDSDDDMPIAELIKKRGVKAKEVVKKSRVQSDKSVKKPEKSEKKSSEKSSSRSEEPPKKAKDAQFRVSTSDSDVFYDTLKGKLVQQLLCRWWYAYEWPRPEDIGQPPPGYEQLDGFLGVFVSTQADTLGKILDLRDKAECPCLVNFVKKPSAELKERCITAIENQIKSLEDLEGEDSVKELKTQLREVKRVDVGKADREGRKYENSFGK